MKLLELEVRINLISLLAILVIIICVVIIAVVIYSYGEKECLSDPVAYANNYSHNYWWDYVVPIRFNEFD